MEGEDEKGNDEDEEGKPVGDGLQALLEGQWFAIVTERFIRTHLSIAAAAPSLSLLELTVQLSSHFTNLPCK